MEKKNSLRLIERALEHRERNAIQCMGTAYTYGDLLERSREIALGLLGKADDLKEARVAFLAPAGFEYVCIQWGIWRAGGIAVPLCEKHPLPSMEYVLRDTGATTLICTPEYAELLGPLSSITPLVHYGDLGKAEGSLPAIGADRRAMILYTSGTTGSPKGVVTTHAGLEAQITALTQAWQWEADDHILNVLPLHHVHGIVNMLCCALWSGACCEFLPKFGPGKVFDAFRRGEVNLFMAVPTIYFKLIAHYQELPEREQAEISMCLKGFRLMVSGSAALPVSVLEQWKAISGHTLLERYGMTEMGMAISNPYEGERRPGYIGQPLPGVTVRLVNDANEEVPEGSPGEIQVKGANVFSEYWGKPEATREAFTEDGWFRTGDVAVWEGGSYRILGRNSVDIIKSGGYKISALEIEEVLRTHEQVGDCGVVGIPDEEWGEIIGAAIVAGPHRPDPEELSEWLRTRLPGYKTPREYIFLDELPRNVLGKVTKNALKDLFDPSTHSR
ncbi:acyl-CoA synthetase [Robiginitalea sp. SC105]|uniref:acyl-CoA synthetase n=1 Tax=Robiginitalea sp. SC105 TaxID=2762332 RepID=UPI00163AD386|nr:acyl-CoA synthetase [Robiginitalea sp. SC105]MBC2837753.1 AMP-binding protein [Robiginitalea sp. SC105]